MLEQKRGIEMCIAIDNRGTAFTKTAIKNDELRQYANTLAEDATNIRLNLLHMSAIMALIASKRDTGILDEFDGSIVTFAESRLGIKKSQTYSMVQVGSTFLDGEGHSLLTERGGKWNNTQFMALLPMAGTGKNKRTPEETLEACKKLVTDKKIKPSMTVAEIKVVVDEERPDATARKIAAQKRKAKANEKAKVAENIKNEEKHDTVQGVKIGEVAVWQLSDGNIRVLFDGEEKPFNDSYIDSLVALLKKATNYQTK